MSQNTLINQTENPPVKYNISDEDKNTLFEKTNTAIWLWANYIIIFFILLSVIVVWIDTIPNISQENKIYLFIVDFIISIVFLVEYIYRWRYSDEKTRFPFRFINILDLLSFLPFFILIIFSWIWTYSIFALFRIFRIFRIFELTERIPIVSKLVIGINKYKVEYLAAVFVIIIILSTFSSIVYFSENRWWNKELFTSIPETFWWSIVTMTNTWYWDIIPTSFVWKLLASILMFLWPILVTILSSITVIVFLESTKIIEFTKKDNICTKCNKPNSDKSMYCNKCWSKF